MGMIISDIHTHSTFSADGRGKLPDMVATAKEKGLRYYGVSDHFDYDFRAHNILYFGKPLPMIDADGYFRFARDLQREVESDGFSLLVGAEFGYSSARRAQEEYLEVVEKYQPDFIVNSIHTCKGIDVYREPFYSEWGKEKGYRLYLDCVRESLEAPYYYDIISHLGYVSRNAPYPNKKFRYEEFPNEIDDILKAIINRDKILEVNSACVGAGSDFLPDTDILTRYFQLGGKNVSFASDAHLVERVAEKRELVDTVLKKIGFTEITVPFQRKRIKLPL